MTLGPRPWLLRAQDIEKHYKVPQEEAKSIAKKLRPCGAYGQDKLFPRRDVEKELEQRGLR